MSNEEKDPSGSRESENIPENSFMDAGIAHDPRVSPSVLRGMEDNTLSEMLNEDGSWKSHALEEDESSGRRGGLRRTLRRWIGH